MKPKKKSLNYIELVPKLIQNSEGLSSELINRIKSNKLFSEFESKASNEFNFFIKESEKRHLGSKYGTKIDFILKASKKRGEKEAYKILNDKFYTDKEIIKERKKMLKKSTNEAHDNINNIIKKIKEIKINKNNNYWLNNSNSNKNIKNNNLRKKFKGINNNNNENIFLIEDKKKFDIKKDEINKIFNREQKKIKSFFDNYKTYLSEASERREKQNDINNNNNIKNKKAFFKKDFTLPKMQLLNYTKSFSHIKTKKDIDDENRINMKKLMQYSISGKDIMPIKGLKHKKYCLTNPNKKLDEIFKDNKYTNTLVLQKAFNECNSFRNKFMNKNETIKEKLGLNKIPSLKEYENLINNNYNNIKRRRQYLNEIAQEKQKYLGKNNKEILNEKIDENLNFLNTFEKYFCNNK